MPATGGCCCCCCCCWCTWLFKKAASGKETPCYWRVTATAAAAAVPTKTRPSRTGKHHGLEGRTESKICVSRGRNVPSEISYKKLAIRFSRLAARSLLAAALLPLRLLLRLLVSAAAYWCLLLPAAACCLLLPAVPCCWCCCWWLLLLLLCCCNQTASKARNSYWCCCCCCCCAHKDTALPDGETPWPWRTNGVQNRRFPGPERPFWNLLEK